MTPCSNKYVLVVGDYFTKWTEAFAIPDMEIATIAHVLVNEFISRFGAPTHLHTDQGRSFESSLIIRNLSAHVDRKNQLPTTLNQMV